MEAAPETISQGKGPSLFSLAKITLIAMSVFSFIGYYAPYVTGLVYFQRLLTLYNVPPGLFEIQPSQVFMYAYSAALEVSGNWGTFITHSYVIPMVFFCTVLFAGEFAVIGWLIRNDKINGTIDQKCKFKIVQLCVGLLTLCLCLTALVAAFPVAIYPLMAFPAKLGVFGADLTFEREQKLYQGGCGVDNPKHVYCKAVVGKGGILGVGYLIITSDNRIALYQPDQTEILKLGDEVVQVMPPDSFKRYQASKGLSAP